MSLLEKFCSYQVFCEVLDLMESHVCISGCRNNTERTTQEGDRDIVVLDGRCYRWSAVLWEGVGVVRPQEWARSAALGIVLLQQEEGSSYSRLCLHLSTKYWLLKCISNEVRTVLFQVRHLLYDCSQEGLLPFSLCCSFVSRQHKRSLFWNGHRQLFWNR